VGEEVGKNFESGCCVINHAIRLGITIVGVTRNRIASRSSLLQRRVAAAEEEDDRKRAGGALSTIDTGQTMSGRDL
jgi:hypothetical protein